MTAFARWRGSLEGLRHGMAEAPPVSGTVPFPAREPLGSSSLVGRVRAIAVASGVRAARGTVAREGQATRTARPEPSSIFHGMGRLGPWVSEESGRVPAPRERAWASGVPAGLLPAFPRLRGAESGRRAGVGDSP